MNSGSGNARYAETRLRICCLLPLLLAAVCLLCACRQEDPVGRASISAKGKPTMVTRNVMTVISDSGIPQYKLVCPLWLVYDNRDTPLWVLPQGPYLTKFDERMQTLWTVACDSAVNNRRTQCWKLMGRVEFKEPGRLLLLTAELNWDQQRQMVYSDSFIHIEQPDKIIEGYGFEGYTSSSGKLTSYVLHHPTASLPYDQQKLDAAQSYGIDPTALPPGAQLP